MSRRRREHPGGLFDRPVQLLTITAILLALAWIWFVGSVHLQEMIVGAVCVALSTAFCALIYSSETLPIDFRLQDVLKMWRVPGEIVKDTFVVILVLFQDLFGGKRAESAYIACGFRAGKHDPLVVGREALTVMYCTMSPNMIIIGIDASQSHMLFHQIKREEISPLARSLGAGQ